ncbi:MAG: MAPEG family protein [Pseudomonadota bacterium]
MLALTAEAEAVMQAVVAMGLLSLVMFVWMYATRLPAFKAANIAPQDAAHPGTYTLPSKVARVADNYNHLFEAPTLFYAIAIATVVVGQADGMTAILAWTYVGLRIAHSLVQATINIVTLRFTLFALGWLALGAMIVRVALALF